MSSSIVANLDALPLVTSNYIAGMTSCLVSPFALTLVQIFSLNVPICTFIYFSFMKDSISASLSLLAGANINVLLV